MKDRTRAARRMLVDKAPGRQQQKRTNQNRWYRIENLVDRPSAAAIYIYDVIGCTCWWDDECRCLTAKNFIDEVQSLRVDELHVHINSPGGEVDDGLAIYTTLRNHRARVLSFIDSLAASAASFIALAGEEVVIAEAGSMMIHDASGIQIGDAADMREFADLLDHYSDKIAGIYARKSSGTVEQWRDLMKVETWFTGAEAVEAGLCDRTDEQDDDVMEEGMTARHNLSLFAFRYAGREAAPAPALTNHADAAPSVVQPESPAEPEAAESEPVVEPAAVAVPEVAAAPEVEATVDQPAELVEPVVPDPVEPVEDIASAPEAVVTPDAPGSNDTETGQDEAASVVDSTADQPEPEPAEPAAADTAADELAAEPVTATTDADPWAQLMSPLLSATPAPSTWDDVFANLTKP